MNLTDPLPPSLSASSDPAYLVILTTVNRMDGNLREMRQDMSSLQRSLQDNYVLRRDADSSNRGLDERVTRLENWRLENGQQMSTFQQTVTSQIGQAVVQAMKDNQATQQQISKQRAFLDERSLGFLQALVVGVVIAIFTYLLTHPH